MTNFFIIFLLSISNLFFTYIVYFQRKKIIRPQKEPKNDLEIKNKLMDELNTKIHNSSQNKNKEDIQDIKHPADCLFKVKENILLIEKLRIEIESPVINHFKVNQILEMLGHLNGNLIKLENMFEKFNPHFSDELQSLFPELTFQEIRLCLLLKLEFNTQDIALILNINKESIYKSRYRLRKKMNIMGDEGLYEILSQIPSKANN